MFDSLISLNPNYKVLDLEISKTYDNDFNKEAVIDLAFKKAFEELILWGSGRKARLTAALLRDMGIRFRWMDLEPDKFPDGIHGHPIEDYRKIESHQGLKLLIGVYPNPAERKDLEDFLVSRNLQKGTDYWYL